MKTIEVEEKDGYAVVTNSDLTEGRGFPVIIAYSLNPYTAKRLAQNKGVQGSNASLDSVSIFEIDGVTYGPIRLSTPTTEDVTKQDTEEKLISLIQKAKSAGLSSEDIELLRKS